MRRSVLSLTVATALFAAITTSAAAAPEVHSILVGGGPQAVAVNSVTHTVYVANAREGSVSVIDGNTRHVTATIQVDGELGDVAINQLTNRVYVASPAAETVAVIDGATNTVISVVPVGQGATVLGVDETTDKVYAGNGSAGSVGVIDGVSSTLIATIPGPGQGFAGVSMDPGRRLAYFSSEGYAKRGIGACGESERAGEATGVGRQAACLHDR